MTEEQPTRKKRGFACISKERRTEIARLGGKAVPSDKRSFSKSKDLAASAGLKGGQSVRPATRSFALNRELAIAAGRKGGEAHRNKRLAPA